MDREMHAAYIASTRLVAAALPGAETANLGEWFVYDANVDNAEFNIAAVAGDPERAAREVGEVAGWFGERGLDWRWKLRPERDEAVIAAISWSGVEAPRLEPYMFRSAEGLGGRAAEGLRIERVTDEATLRAYDMFDVDRGRPPEWSVAAAVMRQPPCSLWIGWEGKQVAARAMAVGTSPVGTIANVVVREAFRRRGFGTAITAATVRACAAEGSSGVCLGASRMGYPMYLRMGFQHRYDLATYPGGVVDG
jgi:GNAT superfamily N-acetyltransferase